jgi:heme oxygenase (biliverdin-IX-beta and delta-forming)
MHPIRSLLREATASAHGRVDDAFTRLNLGRRNDYRRFLAAHASVILPLEALAGHAGAGQVLEDWPGRCRSGALLNDLAALDLQPPPPLPLGSGGIVSYGGPAWVLGVLYVLEGSRLGAQVLRRRVLAGPDAECRAATAYLSHGMGQALWPSFLAQLVASPYAKGDTGPVIEGARDAFAAFERAAPPGAETRDLADVTAP